MRYDVKKILFLGVESNVQLFFRKAQKMGFVQFIDPSPQKKVLPQDIKNYIKALKILKKHERKPQIKDETKVSLDLIQEIIRVEKELVGLKEHLRLLNGEIEKVAPFGHFDKYEVEKIEQTAGLKFQFFVSRKHLETLSDNLFYIGAQYDLYYYLGLSKKEMQIKSLLPLQFDHSVDILKIQKKDAEVLIQKNETLLRDLTQYFDQIFEGYLHHLNMHHLESARSSIIEHLDQKVFTISGFISINHLKQLKELTEHFSIMFEEVVIEKTDKVPTCLENKNLSKVGEDLVYLYDTPGVHDKDPSLWVLIAFAFFFSIIISDAGYGLVFLILSFFLKFKFPDAKDTFKRFIKLAFILSIGCIVWGGLTFNFFGLGISPKSPLAKYSFIERIIEKKVMYHKQAQDSVWQEWTNKYPTIQNLNDPADILNAASDEDDAGIKYEMQKQFFGDIMLELSLIIGAVHIILSLMRTAFSHYANFGWILFIIGGYLYFPSEVNGTSMLYFLFNIPKEWSALVGFKIFIFGIVLACMLAIIQKRLKGLSEITNSIQIFADVLSYLRLYALAFAGMAMAATFNQMGSQMNIVFGTITILVGHVMNLVFATMAGVIHGLRLNFLEWYHYSFEGEGKRFEPLQFLQP